LGEALGIFFGLDADFTDVVLFFSFGHVSSSVVQTIDGAAIVGDRRLVLGRFGKRSWPMYSGWP